MTEFIIHKEVCKGCGLCASVCAKKLLEITKNELNTLGYHPVSLTDESACAGCLMCARICPETAIEITK